MVVTARMAMTLASVAWYDLARARVVRSQVGSTSVRDAECMLSRDLWLAMMVDGGLETTEFSQSPLEFFGWLKISRVDWGKVT
jgi:hypothetical protein